jgi:hypothetical protein
VTLVHVNLLQNKPKMQLAIQTRRFLSPLLLLLLFPVLKQAGDHYVFNRFNRSALALGMDGDMGMVRLL